MARKDQRYIEAALPSGTIVRAPDPEDNSAENAPDTEGRFLERFTQEMEKERKRPDIALRWNQSEPFDRLRPQEEYRNLLRSFGRSRGQMRIRTAFGRMYSGESGSAA